ncbi:dynein regulatory complex subunit 7 [Apis mellifera carnica]|nr:dynein regulatory complex subunit 7 [Apis mellifera carnica]
MEEDEKIAFESYESISTITSVEEEEYKLEEKLTKEGVLKITKELIENVQQELCLIKLCWPEIDYTKDLYLKRLPSSYCTLSDKEKLLAWYAENFRQQFHVKYPKRKPLLLVCENECGIQKFMSTTIKRSTLPYPELYTWQECGKFVSDYVKYEPLSKPLKMDNVTG